ncbi:MAG: energy transducer TonB [Acidobacteriia bacterium]|nr:energy transducer TonB [Terriglobia bacterium]
MLCYVRVDARQLRLPVAWWVGLILLLNLPAFILYLAYSAAKTGNWKRATVPSAYILQVALIGLLVLYPLMRMDALPKVWSIPVVPPAPPPAGPPPGARVVRSAPRQRVSLKTLLATPPSIPRTIAQIHEAPLPPEDTPESGPWVPGAIPGGPGGGVLGSMIGSIGWGTAAPAPPPRRAAVPHPKVIRVGGQVIAAKAIYQPTPDYPPLAKMARIQGMVRLQAMIGKDGTVQDLKALSGHPWLVGAAIAAVQHWRYQPTLLNGEPVEVLTEIDVTFRLAE